MTVIGDNIANVNTIAYKSNSSSFANVLSTSLAGATNSGIGRGVEFWAVTPSWTQGSLENTSSPTDLSINGNGFFMVNDLSGSSFYTRAGQFHLDDLGNMVNPDGHVLQGYEVLEDGSLGNLTDVSIPGDRISPPSATENFQFDINLNSGAAESDTYSASQTVFDSLGNAIPMTLTFTKTADAQQWSYAVSIPDTAATVSYATAGGSALNPATDLLLEFDADGVLTGPTEDIVINLSGLSNGASDLEMTWDLFDDTGSNYGDLTGFASNSNTTFQYQDGFSAGMLRGISVDEEGVVTAAYSNGELVPVYQVALVDFASYEGLTKMGKNLYAESRESGQPMPGVVGDGRLGSITPMAIEMSNVDLAQEFVKMITTQRAFQANSRVITASDEILTELINIKR
jgi:flagellar hook protein FlgE